ncbi:MAG: RNA polymerase subunit sigma-70 [Marivirga sp.]|nr:RNA polymerase subunit sigma-70 [Marivirga sp.]
MEVLTIANRSSHRAAREKLFEEIYEEAFPMVAAFVSHMKGSLQDAKDIFQDSLVIFFEKSEDPDFKVSTSPERYILGIAKHLWIKKYKQDSKNVSLNVFESSIFIPVDFFPAPHSVRLLQFMEAAGKKCLDLLRAFYFEKQTMRDMAKGLGYSNEHSATVQKYKCLEKIRETVKEKSITYEDFFE